MDSVPAFVSRKHLVDGQTNVETAQEQVAIAESLQASNRTIVSVQDTLDNTPAPRLLSLFRHGQRVYLRIRDGTWRPGTIERREFGEGFSSGARIGVILDGETIFREQDNAENLHHPPDGLNARKQPPENMQG